MQKADTPPKGATCGENSSALKLIAGFESGEKSAGAIDQSERASNSDEEREEREKSVRRW